MTDRIFHYMGILLMAVFILVFLFWVNNYRYLIYALTIGVIIFSFRKTSGQDWKVKGRDFLMILGGAYFALLTIFSVSPFLKFKEFQWTHPAWQETKVQIFSYTSDWEKPFRRVSGYAYTSVSYQYKVVNQSYRHTEHEVEKLYYPIWESKERIQILKRERQQRSKQQIEKQGYILLYNTGHPKESKFFISRSLFYLKGSGIYAFSIFMGTLIVLLIINVMLARKS